MLDIIVNNRKIDKYNHEKKTYVEGRKGSNYEISFYNNSPLKRLVVISVDGLNTLSGDKNWERGFVVGPWDVIRIPGWSKNNIKAAKFVFSSPSNSYNSKNIEGDEANIGVIGAMIYDEKPQVVYNNSYNTFNTFDTWPRGVTLGAVGQSGNMGNEGVAGSWGGASAGVGSVMRSASKTAQCSYTSQVTPTAAVEPNLGTGWGKESDFKIRETTFNRNSWHTLVETLYYDSRKNLELKGIIQKEKIVRKEPNPFPSSGFCPAPTR